MATFRRENNQEAIKCWSQTVRLTPNDQEAHDYLAQALEAEGYVDKAVEHYASTVQLKPDHSKTHARLGSARTGREYDFLTPPDPLSRMVLTPLMSLTAKSELFQVKLHQVLEILLEILLGEIREKLRLGALVDFADAVNQLPFTHTTHPFHKTNCVPFNLRNIDTPCTFSLA